MRQTKSIRLQAEKEFPLPPAKLWFLISHMEHMLHMLGFSRVSYEPYAEGPHILYRRASPINFLRRWIWWKEYPYEWIRNDSVFLLREFDWGPLQRYGRGIELVPTEHGTLVRVFVELVPRWPGLGALWRWRGRKWLHGVLRYCSQFLAVWIQQQRYDFPRRRHSPVRIKGWERRMAAFAASNPHTENLLSRLKQHLAEATDDEVTGMRPKELADRWGYNPDQVVRLFLYAAAERLLRIEWTVVCPATRLPEGVYRHLKDIPGKGRSRFTLRPFDIDFHQSTELRFSVHPAIRQTRAVVDGPAGPAKTPHIWVQYYLPPGGRLQAELQMGEEAFRCRTFRTDHSCHLLPSGQHASGPTVVRLALTRQGWMAPTVVFRPGTQLLELVNETHSPAVVALERVRQDTHFLSAAEATALQEFVYLFPHELPAPGQRFATGPLHFLVADIPHSTDRIEAWGERAALARIHQVLWYVGEQVHRHRGRVVKTQGDQLFAVFASVSGALETAFAIQLDLNKLHEKQGWKEPVPVRVAVHGGPAFALYRGAGIDYFGVAVNRVFRLVKRASGGEVALARDYHDAEAPARVLASLPYERIPKVGSGPACLCLRPLRDRDEITAETELPRTGTR